ncbi:MAG: hypothetical protein A3I00_05835 [Betaproteobacteria bacterium RIFCSPLOWO2_02_FULL_64_12]|nr:MAG: hypothetical protein A3I00_05835 [Betaproteobacteria bacterium RIFCSPLOWO2_02_FULL_64_12]
MSLAVVPSLDELAHDPARAATLTAEVKGAVILQVAAVLTALSTPTVPTNGARPEPAPTDDRLLTADEAAAILGVTPTWLYRHAKTLPYTRRLSRKVLRFSEAGLRRWQAARRP